MKHRQQSYAFLWTFLIVLGLVAIGRAQTYTWQAQPGYAAMVQSQINSLKASLGPQPGPGSNGYFDIVNAGASGFVLAPLSGDVSSSSSVPGKVTVNGTGGNPFGPFATQGIPCQVSQGCTGAITANSGFNNLSPMTTLGDTIYENALHQATRLPGNTGANRQFLVEQGTGSVSAAPLWQVIQSGDIANALLTAPAIGTISPSSIIETKNLVLVGSTSGTVTMVSAATAGTQTDVWPPLSGNVIIGTNQVGPIAAQRVTTGSLSGTTFTNVTLTWTTAFADTNYTATCSVLSSVSAAQGLEVDHIQSIAAGSIVVVVNNPTGGSLTGTLECTAVHD